MIVAANEADRQRATQTVPHDRAEQLQRVPGPSSLDLLREAVERDLRDDGAYARVLGRDENCVRSAERVTPQQTPVGVDAFVTAGESDGGAASVIPPGPLRYDCGAPPAINHHDSDSEPDVNVPREEGT
ncbi:hypothetical protein [Nocardia araoensis]|uniref:hypothetical protein n=1 Tax=Nocardia araoensis TaxID=228600 RepID=UPI00030382F4|nr:hypothetical protein [Nocardia araoensis]